MANSITKFHVLPFFASEILSRLTLSVADSTVRMLLNRVLFCEYESTAPPSTSVASESLNGKMRVKCHVAMWSSKVQSHFSSFSHFSLWEFFFAVFFSFTNSTVLEQPKRIHASTLASYINSGSTVFHFGKFALRFYAQPSSVLDLLHIIAVRPFTELSTLKAAHTCGLKVHRATRRSYGCH